MQEIKENKKKSKIEFAEEVLAYARDLAHEGYSTSDYKKIRDSAEKAYLAAVDATDYAMASYGQFAEPGPKSHSYRHRFLQETIGERSWDKDYTYFADVLHGQCFYGGECPTEQTMEILLKEVEQYIEKIKKKIS